MDTSGRRLAKRDADLALAELRASGTDPRAIVAWAAASAGISVERARADEVTRLFDLNAVRPTPQIVDAHTVEVLRNARV